MAYEAKTNWQLNDTVMPEDMNRIEQQVLLNSQMGEQIIEQISPEITEISNKIGETGDTGATEKTGTVMGKLNNIISNMISMEDLYGTGDEFTTAGSHSFTTPPGITQIRVTACGAGGGGGRNEYTGGGGGGGGAAVNRKLYTVSPNKTYSVTVGKGGTGQTSSSSGNGTAGGSTVISGVVTLAGGSAGRYNTGGDAGGTGGGDGGNGAKEENGSAGILGTGGEAGTKDGSEKGGGGGGGSLGNGGAGGKSGVSAKAGTKGGGGGGGYANHSGASGGNGYVKVEWVW